jgi:hypothetical protein
MPRYPVWIMTRERLPILLFHRSSGDRDIKAGRARFQHTAWGGVQAL